MKTGHVVCGIALVALMNCVSFVLGQEQGGFAGNEVTNLTKSDLVGVPNKQVIANIYEVPAGAMVPLHFHHGDEFHLVLAGEWAAEVEGRPIKNLKAGESQYVEGGRWRGGKVISSDAATWFDDSGQGQANTRSRQVAARPTAQLCEDSQWVSRSTPH
jgi:quercetin dioxygenase-like cupin family protein